MIEHTPGPWRIQGSDKDFVTFDSVGQGALVCGHNKDANVALIAAAPDLLEALEAVFDEWQEMPEDMSGKALAAIRKATGRA